MHKLTGLPVDDDIVDRIFYFCASVDVLSSLALTCKAFHDVYSRHPNSITRATAYNITGPALPQAIRIIRFKSKYLDSEDYDEDEPFEGDDDEIPPLESTDIPTITSAELRTLERVAEVAGNLENLFSIR